MRFILKWLMNDLLTFSIIDFHSKNRLLLIVSNFLCLYLSLLNLSSMEIDAIIKLIVILIYRLRNALRIIVNK